MQIRLYENAFCVSFAYDRNLVGILQGVKGVRWDRHSKNDWWVPAVPGSVRVLLKLQSMGFTVDQASTGRITELRGSIPIQYDEYSSLLGGLLHPFQVDNVDYCLKKKRVIVGDQPGLGKTVTALATIAAAHAYPAIIVCPSSVKINWYRQSMHWIKGVSAQVFSGRSQQMIWSDIIIINYDILPWHVDALKGINPKAIVLDESHMVKDSSAKRSKAAKAISSRAEYRLLLSGTILKNRPEELISQFQIIDVLDEVFHGWKMFTTRFCGARNNGYGLDLSGATNLSVLHRKMKKNFFIRKTKAEVLKDLPPKVHSVLPVDIDNATEYNRAQDDIVRWLKDRALEEDQFVESLSGLTTGQQEQAKSDRAKDVEYKANKTRRMMEMNQLRILAARGKIKAAIEWAEEFLETGEKLVVFAWHVEICEALARHFTCPLLIGKTPTADRQVMIDRFQTDPSCNLFVLNIAAGGVGITLHAASDVLFVEYPWSPADLEQAEDRCHRIGQRDSVTAWYMVGNGTIDELMLDALMEKKKILDAVMDGKDVDSDESAFNKVMSALLGKTDTRNPLLVK